MFTYKKLNYPEIPKHLILSLENVRKQPGIPLLRQDGDVDVLDKFKAYKVNDDLLDWLKKNIDVDFIAEYIVMTTWTLKHVDNGRTRAINYIIETGGDWISTEFFDPTNPEVRIDGKFFPPNRWYLINTEIPHAVTGIPTTRYILSLTPVKNAFWCVLPNAKVD